MGAAHAGARTGVADCGASMCCCVEGGGVVTDAGQVTWDLHTHTHYIAAS